MGDKYDVVVGIPSHNEANTIGHVVKSVGQGLDRYFPDLKSIIVNCDNCSTDGTKEIFLAANIPQRIAKKYIASPEGVAGKGDNFLNLFRFCRDSNAAISVVVDADLKSIKPEWMKHLGYPVKDGHDYVTPLYARHQFDGTITNHLFYPLIFSLLGLDVRQPMGGEFAFSSKLCSHWLGQEWNAMSRRHGIDVFVPLNAFSGNFKTCQAELGAKVHKANCHKQNGIFHDVIYTLFSLLNRNREQWMRSPHDTDEAFGNGYSNGSEDAHEILLPNGIDMMTLKAECRERFEKNRTILKKYLSSYAYKHFHEEIMTDQFNTDIMLWSQTVYKFLYLFDVSPDDTKMDIISALKPLYLARSITFDYQTYHYSFDFAEEEIRKQAMAFLSQKPYLLGLYKEDKYPLK